MCAIGITVNIRLDRICVRLRIWDVVFAFSAYSLPMWSLVIYIVFVLLSTSILIGGWVVKSTLDITESLI